MINLKRTGAGDGILFYVNIDKWALQGFKKKIFKKRLN